MNKNFIDECMIAIDDIAKKHKLDTKTFVTEVTLLATQIIKNTYNNCLDSRAKAVYMSAVVMEIKRKYDDE